MLCPHCERRGRSQRSAGVCWVTEIIRWLIVLCYIGGFTNWFIGDFDKTYNELHLPSCISCRIGVFHVLVGRGRIACESIWASNSRPHPGDFNQHSFWQETPATYTHVSYTRCWWGWRPKLLRFSLGFNQKSPWCFFSVPALTMLLDSSLPEGLFSKP